MLRVSLLSLGLVASAIGLSRLGTAYQDPGLSTGIEQSTSAECVDRLALSPVLMYSSAGSTLLGPQFDHITVYSNGLVLMAAAESHSKTMSARMAQVSAQSVVDLGRVLTGLGAGTLCDQAYDVSDVPLKTVSFGSSMGTDIRVHSFSYWLPTDQHGQIESAIEQWMLENHLIGSTLE
jgi:hypothetical protein